MGEEQRLHQGAQVAIVGGGPAGSLFALYLLKYAREARLPLAVTIYEPKSFADAGAKGCNRCAGVLSPRFLRNLRSDLGLHIPEGVAQSCVTSYELCSPYGVIEVSNPDPEVVPLSIFRGGGPRLAPLGAGASFDSFLLTEAQRQGGEVVAQRVEGIALAPRPSVIVDGQVTPCHLLVLACGVNSAIIGRTGSDYAPPLTHGMVVDELLVGREEVKAAMGTTARVFLLPDSDLIFGSLVPKGPFINVSLLSRGQAIPEMDDFLEHPLVKRSLPFPYQRVCGCKATIAVTSAKNPYRTGFVAVGDACVTRLYKDGLGSALRTARQAARTVVFHGISHQDFHRHYRPVCLALQRDNWFGQVLFAIHHRVKGSAAFFQTQQRLAAREQALPAGQRLLGQVNWGMFSGNYTYRQIFSMCFRPRFVLTLVLSMVRERVSRPKTPSVRDEPA